MKMGPSPANGVVRNSPRQEAPVDPITLCATLCAFLPLQIIEARDRGRGGSRRQRKRDVLSLVIAAVMTPGSDDSDLAPIWRTIC